MTLLKLLLFIVYLFIFLALFLFLISQVWIDFSNMKLKSKFGLPYVPTSRKRLRKIMELADIKPGDNVIDLGSGDGRMVIAAAKKGATAVGYELNPVLVWLSQFKIWIFGLSKNAKIKRENLFDADFSQYNVFLLYTMPWVMEEIRNRLNTNKYDMIRVISNTFKFGDIEPKVISEKEKIYLYEFKKENITR